MTDAQYANLPGILREIVDCDRRIDATRRRLAALTVVPLAEATPFRKLRQLQGELRERARGLYGSRPLRGDNGPGRPTAAAV